MKDKVNIDLEQVLTQITTARRKVPFLSYSATISTQMWRRIITTCDQTGGYTVREPDDMRTAEKRPFANDKIFHCCPDRGEESGDPLPRRDIQKP